MAEKVILTETTLSGFVLEGDFAQIQTEADYSLSIGETYYVVWDGETYECVGQDMSVIAAGAVGLGNLGFFGGIGNDEPFFLGVADGGALYSAMDDNPTHTIKIYQEATNEVGIVQYDRSGNRLEFYGKKVIRVPTTDGGTKDFVGATLTEKTVELDFSGGDMTIEPGAEEFYTKVTVPVPGTLIPANIAEGVNIAGIVGTLAAGGGGVQASCGTIVGTGALFTLEHGLGVIPDIVVIEPRDYTRKASSIINAFHVSTKGAEILGTYKYGKITTTDSNNIGASAFNIYPIEHEEASSESAIYGATNENLIIGTTSQFLMENVKYYWFAIGGLT